MAKKDGVKYKETSPFKWYEAVLKLLDGAIDHKEYVSLERRLLGSPADFDEYLELIIIYSCMHEPKGLFDNIITFDSSAEPNVDMEVLEELEEYEKNSQPVEVERIEEPAERILTKEERQAKIRAFLAEEKTMEEQERRLEEEARLRIRERELKRRQRAQMVRNVATKVRRYLRNAAVAAMLMVVGFFVYALSLSSKPAFVATLTDGVDVKWADSKQPAQLDSLLRPELMKLIEGYAEITFHGGAKSVIEAPVEIELQSIERAYLHTGKMSAIVPVEARGFTVNTPSALIVDLGTEFGVHVKEDGSSDIHVFKGRISLLAGKIESMIGKLFGTVQEIVEAGQARRVVKGSNRIEDVLLDRSSFVKKVAKTITPAYDSTINPIRRILYFPFDAINSKRAINRVSNEPIGEFIGQASVAMTGADDGKLENEVLALNGGCVHIDNLIDRGSSDGYTFVMWVRSDIIEFQQQILRHVFFAKKRRLEGYSMAPLELELYMADDVSLVLCAGSDELRNSGFDFDVQVEDVELTAGSWFHVAAVVSPNLGQLYINGIPREELQWGMSEQIAVELLSAGSWDILIGASKLSWDGSTFLIEEEFHGSVDDFTIFDKVLSQEEVTTLYLNTKNDR